jgi:hypothetical protein
MNHPASELSALQLAALYRDFATVQAYVAETAERITLVNRFAHRAPAPVRHAHSDRFANWRLKLRVAELAAIYGRAPLLQGLQRRAVVSGSGGFHS